MNLRCLKYLVAIADFGHFGKAASHCCVSQPTLSIQIKKLEDFFGVALIERTTKSLRLTQVGEAIVQRARSLLTEIEGMKAIAQATRDPFAGQLTIGVIPTFAPYVLPQIIPGLSKAFPKLKLFLLEEKTSVLLQKLRQAEVDTALLAVPLAEQGFSIAPLFKEEFLFAVSCKHELSTQEVMKTSSLKNRRILLLDEGHCMREQALEFCQKSKLVEAGFKATSLETLRHMVAANAGMTLMPRLAAKVNDGIRYIPFASPKPTRTAALIWRNSDPRIILLNAIVSQIKKSMNKQNVITL